MRGVSSSGVRYYRDSSRIERTCDCPQRTVRAEAIEESVVKVLQEIVDYSIGCRDIRTSNANLQKAETRFERAKELYMQGEMTRESFQAEKERYEKAQNSLQFTNLNAIMTLCMSLQPALQGWEGTLPIERKKLLRTAVQAAFLRGNVIVAVQLTDSFMPLVTQKSCSSGEGGIFVYEY